MRAHRAHCRDRCRRARAQDRVLGDQCAVEVGRECGDPRRESLRKFYGTVPPVDFTTYAATSAISCDESVALNDGIEAPPSVTWPVTVR